MARKHLGVSSTHILRLTEPAIAIPLAGWERLHLLTKFVAKVVLAEKSEHPNRFGPNWVRFLGPLLLEQGAR